MLLPSGPLVVQGFQLKEFRDNPTIFQVSTCPRGLASGAAQAACTLSHSLSRTHAPGAGGEVTETVPFQLQLTQATRIARLC